MSAASARALAELRRARTLHELPLDGLPEHDVAALIADRVEQAASEAFARQIAQRTDGNPLFIEELLRHVDDPAGPAPGLAVPATVKDLLLRRLERLDEACRRALGVASVAGQRFELAVLARVLQTEPDELAECLDVALHGHVLAEEAGAIGHYRFAHPLIREAIYGELSATRRALVHRRLGDAIAAVHADRLDEHAGALAHHYHAAGDAERAFEYHGRAAKTAERSMAPEVAFEHLTGAIAAGELLGRTAASDAAMRELYCRRGWMATFVGRSDTGERDYEAALEGARAAGDRRLEMEALNGLGLFWHVRDLADSARHHEQALAIAEQLGDEPGQVVALDRLAIAYAHQVDFSRALSIGERALAVARATGDEQTLSRAMDGLKLVAYMLGDTERLEQLTAALESIQRRRDDIWLLQWTLLESAFAPIAKGCWDEGAARLDEAQALSRRIGDRASRGLILSARCWLERSRGDYARALAAGREAAASSERGPGEAWRGWTLGTLAQPLADLRAWPAARAALEDALAAAERIDARAQTFWVVGDLAWVRLRDGDEPGARAAARRWDELAARMRVPPGQAYLYASGSYLNRARAAVALGDVDRAEAIVAGVLAPIERSGLRDAAAEAQLVLAACAEARADARAAGELLARGLRALPGDGLPATRLAIRLAQERLACSPTAAAEARALIAQIAASVGEPALADGFRAAALAELEPRAPALS